MDDSPEGDLLRQLAEVQQSRHRWRLACLASLLLITLVLLGAVLHGAYLRDRVEIERRVLQEHIRQYDLLREAEQRELIETQMQVQRLEAQARSHEQEGQAGQRQPEP